MARMPAIAPRPAEPEVLGKGILNLADVRIALSEVFTRTKQELARPWWARRSAEVFFTLREMLTFLSSFTEEHIEQMPAEQRAFVSKILSEQAERFQYRMAKKERHEQK